MAANPTDASDDTSAREAELQFLAPDITDFFPNLGPVGPEPLDFHEVEPYKPVVPNQVQFTAGGLALNAEEQLLYKYALSLRAGSRHVAVFDTWTRTGLSNNVYAKTLQLKPTPQIPVGTITFEETRIYHPRIAVGGVTRDLTPQYARKHNLTYGVDVTCLAKLWRGKPGVTQPFQSIVINCGLIPIPLGSHYCHLRGKTPTQLAEMGEDPKDPLGYFVVSGVEKTIPAQELLVLNKILLMNDGPAAKIQPVACMTANTIRGTVLVKMGLGKKLNIIKLRLPSLRVKKGEKPKSMNILRIFRLMGAHTPPLPNGQPDSVADGELIKAIIARFLTDDQRKAVLLKLTASLVDLSIDRDDKDLLMAKMGKNKEQVAAMSIGEKDDLVRKMIELDVFPHVNTINAIQLENAADYAQRIVTYKTNLLAIMAARFLQHLAGFRPLDDRDSWSNKRIEGAGRQMEQLFRSGWRKAVGIVQANIDAGSIQDLAGVAAGIKHSLITDAFNDSFRTSNWGVKGSKMKENVSQTLIRDNVVATYAHIDTVDVAISRTDRQASIRLVQDSQYGFIDPVSTPEGSNCGLLKAISLTPHISTEGLDTDIIRLLLGNQPNGADAKVDLNFPRAFAKGWKQQCIANGKFLGWCDGPAVATDFVNKRRKSELPYDMGVVFDDNDNCVYIDISPSRLVRPLLIVSANQTLLLDDQHLRNASPEEWRQRGVMEFISPWEQEYIKIARSPADLIQRLKDIADAQKNLERADADLASVVDNVEVQVIDAKSTTQGVQGKPLTLEEAKDRVEDANQALARAEKVLPFTHCELCPQSILGIASSLIPYPDHNQAPRNTYQVSMGKQALGIYHSNHGERFDGKTKLLVTPETPIVKTLMYDVIGLDQRGSCQNAMTAFMAYPGNEEDAFVSKHEALDNGAFRITKYLVYKTTIRLTGSVLESLKRPTLLPNDSVSRYRFIENNGLPMIGAPLRQGDAVIGKEQRIQASDQTPEQIFNDSVILRVGDEGIVDKVLLTSDKKIYTVTVKLRVTRIPTQGDKLAPRNAQKGTLGPIYRVWDLPWAKDGTTPDILPNPHSIPSRMTTSYPLELLATKYGALKGTYVNAGPFAPIEGAPDGRNSEGRSSGGQSSEGLNLQNATSPVVQSSALTEWRTTLKRHGYQEFGYEFTRSGTSGKSIPEPINMAPICWQALRHTVLDKIQARGSGMVRPMTRQPSKGRGNQGGLRYGEMERDAGISHGASSFLRERLMFASDVYQTAVCRRCGTFAVNDAKTQKYSCRLCHDKAHFGRIVIPYVYKLLTHLLAAPGFNLYLGLEDPDQYQERMNELGQGADDALDLDAVEAEQGEEPEKELVDEADALDEDDGNNYMFDD